ncbi:hypothetical protein Cgig2_023385 [Carnegiea gigantea]|uniref:Reverse transcriptase zinc-binding domain-containing protein n=1 Tax=Carnegiea gigantea TaxID=171969 RepID=A0A9Q1GPH5_9CARY|nr:hypothetical protein Cgig2_023385 [Carnegiea gigantea]
MDYTHVTCTVQGLSDHTPLKISFLYCPNGKPSFMFCEMWCWDPMFKRILLEYCQMTYHGTQMQHVYTLLTRIKRPLWQLNRDRYLDIHEQQGITRRKLGMIQEQLQEKPLDRELLSRERGRDTYMHILHSSLSLIKQQSKAIWLSQGDQCTQAFMARIKQRKMQAYVYVLKDDSGILKEGFGEVAQIMLRISREPIDREVMMEGTVVDLEQQMQLIAPFTDKDIKDAMFSIHSVKSPGRNSNGGTKDGEYSVHSGYAWCINELEKPKWARLTWGRLNIPRHAFTSWLLMKQRLPVRSRLAKYTGIPALCQTCQMEDESHEHLFYNCIGIIDVWKGARQWLQLTEKQSWQEWVKYVLALRRNKAQKQVICAVFNAVIYYIWGARNQLIFKGTGVSTTHILKMVNEQIIQRVLYKNKGSQNYHTCIDQLLR